MSSYYWYYLSPFTLQLNTPCIHFEFFAVARPWLAQARSPYSLRARIEAEQPLRITNGKTD